MQSADLEVWFYPFARCLMLGDLFIFSELPFSYLWSADFVADDCLQYLLLSFSFPNRTSRLEVGTWSPAKHYISHNLVLLSVVT